MRLITIPLVVSQNIKDREYRLFAQHPTEIRVYRSRLIHVHRSHSLTQGVLKHIADSKTPYSPQVCDHPSIPWSVLKPFRKEWWGIP